MSASHPDRELVAPRSRYEVFKSTRTSEVFALWNRAQISLWAAESGRGREIEAERRDRWQFPTLLTPEHHREYDEWLNRRFPERQGAFPS